ncbi:MAG: D-glycero-alpha-D-manno-heptose-1,7-bisphosphate 7-phosphatase [Bryobacteraceae bacterium]
MDAQDLDGLHRRFTAPATTLQRPAVFLDRDGVIIEEIGYLHDPCQVRYLPGALDAIARMNRAGVAVVVVTNQAGIGRGYYGWDAFKDVQERIATDLAAAGGWLDGEWACAFHPDATIEALAHTAHPFRKPNPGMIEEAARCLHLRLDKSWLVGDKVCDIEAAVRAGLQGAIHVATGYGLEHRAAVNSLRAASGARIDEAEDLARAVELVLAPTVPSSRAR